MKGIHFKPWKIKFIAEHPDMELQTRRVIKFHKPFESHSAWEVIYPDGGGNWIAWDKDQPGLAEFTKKAYQKGEGFKSRYQAGEVVYIKEAWRYFGGEEFEYQRDPKCVIYRYDVLVNLDIYKWHNPRGMPAWAARYHIQILEVTPQRLQEITEEDAIKEGCQLIARTIQPFELKPTPHFTAPERPFTYKDHFIGIWDSINPLYSWANNDWVFRYTFKLVPSPIKDTGGEGGEE